MDSDGTKARPESLRVARAIGMAVTAAIAACGNDPKPPSQTPEVTPKLEAPAATSATSPATSASADASAVPPRDAGAAHPKNTRG